MSFPGDVDKTFNFLGVHCFVVVLVEFEGGAHYAQIQDRGSKGKHSSFVAIFLGRFLLPLHKGIKLFRGNVDILALGLLIALNPDLIEVAVREEQIRVDGLDFGIFVVNADENMGQSDFIVLGT